MNRRGSSLIEVLIAISLSGAVLALIAALVGAMLHTDASARQASRQSSELARLSLRFRADAHAATEARVERPANSEATRLTLVLAENRSIEFLTENGRVDRILKEGDAVLHRDSFLLGDLSQDVQAKIDFENSESAPPGAAIAIGWRAAVEPGDAAAFRVSRIEAEIGRDQRLSAQPTNSSEVTP